uniref:Metallo-beta-lactamase domain-containing protein n=1 Tax=Timspurckia oligopyrenoides TaxID=708627 RepID=A0A7S0ZM65_9RHOD|mmetsp:Transcript_9886/g.17813  ORF Transcript_9886/g.17813 Transcript_9886/m.17813 type:complete len:352 (+) Transcript_9886:357-1412(+)|eukprot:CAMPEP_0182443140 /NCGR_PEP_ID=MMETSP1172-20130603/1947_1 /TAXON_ID=708627 /ORGANISM="Timspurckia oligopyrenoides, Strain CCMP3278" /LENGTH=351 /DNA_ID=CAMNT_0024638309 /DNA_START=305 /DNA_END=1360 /DNA_ORIENTATION=+
MSDLKAHHKDNSFINPWDSFRKEHAKTTVSIIGKTRKEPSKVDIAAIQLLAQRPNFDLAEPSWRETRRNVGVTWIGHCTFLLQMYGATVLTDPNWNAKASSPFVFGGVKRLVPPPVAISELPKIDAVVITADRSDKLDKATIKELGNRCKYLVPLKVGSVVESCGISRENIIELDWWEEVSLGGVRFICCPAQHFSGATSMDNKSSSALWCSWAFIGVRARVYYCGSTGYRIARRGQAFLPYKEREDIPACPAFKEIGAKFGPFDLSFLPVANYTPRHMISSLHIDPMDATCLHRDLRSRQSVAHSWGTFNLGGEEDTLDSLRLLEQALMQVGVADSEFSVVHHGVTKIMY